jgi:hypothetical protein
MSDQQIQATVDEYANLRELPGFVDATRLKDVVTATTVRMTDGRILVTDGPFADTKEWFGGLFVVDADNLDGALEIAARIPSVRLGGSIEVRPVWDDTP